jgi:hypothetical protein
MATSQNGFAAAGEVQGGLPRTSNIPMNIVQNGLMSGTARASDCFISQKFSYNLQAFLIGYVGSIYSDYSIYK